MFLGKFLKNCEECVQLKFKDSVLMPGDNPELICKRDKIVIVRENNEVTKSLE